MAYTPVTFVDDVTPLNAANMNHLEDAIEALDAVPPVPAPVINGRWLKGGASGAMLWGLIQEVDVQGLPADLTARELTANKGIANGYASLGADGKVPTAQLPPLGSPLMPIGYKAADWTLSAAEAGALYMVDNAANVTVTVDGTVTIPVGAQYHFIQWNTGKIGFVGAGGATLVYRPGNWTAGQYATATLIKLNTSHYWMLTGNVIA